MIGFSTRCIDTQDLVSYIRAGKEVEFISGMF